MLREPNTERLAIILLREIGRGFQYTFIEEFAHGTCGYIFGHVVIYGIGPLIRDRETDPEKKKKNVFDKGGVSHELSSIAAPECYHFTQWLTKTVLLLCALSI